MSRDTKTKHQSPAHFVERMRNQPISNDRVFLTWNDLTSEDLKTFESTPTVESKRNYLQKSLNLDSRYPLSESAGNEARQRIILDLSMQTIAFCSRNSFPGNKTSTLFSIVLATHIFSAETSYSPQPLSICFKTFQELILKHSVESPPFAIAVFDLADVNAITNHMINTYFRHLKLYQYVFGTTKELELLTHPAQAQQVNMTRIPPLSSATSSEAPEQQEESGQQSEIQQEESKKEETELQDEVQAPPPKFHSHFSYS